MKDRLALSPSFVFGLLLALVVALPAQAQQENRGTTSLSLFTCLPVFDDYSAHCEGDFWAVQLRFDANRRYNAAGNFLGYRPTTFASSLGAPQPMRRNRPGDRLGTGVTLSVDGTNTIPKPPPGTGPITLAAASQQESGQASLLASLSDDGEISHKGLYSFILDGYLPLALPADRLSLDAFAGLGFGWVTEDNDAPGLTVDSQFGIPALSYGIDLGFFLASRIELRAQLRNTTYFPGELTYRGPNGNSATVTVDRIVKLNFMIGAGVLF